MTTNGDRVRTPAGGLGTVRGQEVNGKVYVRLDQGSSANYDVADLRPAEDKAWPPGGLETK